MSFSVIIPTKDDDNVISCVRSILHTHPSLPPEKIIIIDDGLSIETQDLLGKHRMIPGVKPFVFARNCNLGIDLAGQDDVILLNDDTTVIGGSDPSVVDTGFDLLSLIVEHSGYGLVSASVTGGVGNGGEQIRQFNVTGSLREASRMVCFICVYIPRSTINAVGKLDERFIHYGFDDDDYCLRVRTAFLKIGITDLVVVEHGVKPSSYRGHGHRSLEPNQKIFREKWGDLR